MSKNLTNIQLKIITDRILTELRKKIITDKVYTETCNNIKEEINYKSLKEKAKRYDEIQKEISLLQQEANILNTEIKNPFDKNIYIRPGLEGFLNLYEKKVESKLNSLLPNRFDIESEIILNSIQGSKNIVEDILKKYI